MSFRLNLVVKRVTRRAVIIYSRALLASVFAVEQREALTETDKTSVLFTFIALVAFNYRAHKKKFVIKNSSRFSATHTQARFTTLFSCRIIIHDTLLWNEEAALIIHSRRAIIGNGIEISLKKFPLPLR